MARDRKERHIRVSSRRVSTGSNLMNSLLPEERQQLAEELETSPERYPSTSQAQALSFLDHPILMIYTLIADDPEEPTDIDLERVDEGLERVAVAIAFPRMSALQARSAALEAKTYQVNPVYWRSSYGFVDDLGDDIGEGSAGE